MGSTFRVESLLNCFQDENRIGQISPEMEEFKTMLMQVMELNLDRYRMHFQFGWTGSPELANSVAMETLSLPHLLVVNTSRFEKTKYSGDLNSEHLNN